MDIWGIENKEEMSNRKRREKGKDDEEKNAKEEMKKGRR